MTASVKERKPLPEPIRGIKVIDADTHLTEPADLWTSRAPAKYRKVVPRVVRRDGAGFRRQGHSLVQAETGQGPAISGNLDLWVVGEDVLLGEAGGGSVINRDNVKIYGAEFVHFPLTDVSPAASFLEPRLDLMDEVGIWGQIIYPNVVGFGGQKFGLIEDVVLRNLCATIWNDAMVELYQQSAGRLNGMAVLPWWDVRAAVAEVERVHGLGLKGVNISADPQNNGLPDLSDLHWEPLWEVCEALNMPINFHIGASQTQNSWYGNAPWPSFDNDRKTALGSAVLYLANARVIGNLIYSGILERHPRLKFVSVESGIGWIPFLLEALDYQVVENGVRGLSMKPSEYFQRQMFACFWFENAHMLEDIERVGVDKCMYETDFPHPTCLYPEPLRDVSRILASVDFDTRKKLLSGTAAAVYNIGVPD
jgi:uncharacterized protein